MIDWTDAPDWAIAVIDHRSHGLMFVPVLDGYATAQSVDGTFKASVSKVEAWTVVSTRPSGSALDSQVGGGHYKDFKIQPIEYIHANQIPYLDGNVVKYVSRHRSKNGAEDIKKAIHYLQLILELEYSDETL